MKGDIDKLKKMMVGFSLDPKEMYLYSLDPRTYLTKQGVDPAFIKAILEKPGTLQAMFASQGGDPILVVGNACYGRDLYPDLGDCDPFLTGGRKPARKKKARKK